MIGELTTPQYCFTGGKFQIEPKENIKDRLGRSPDYADGLGLTFAIPDAEREEEILTRLRDYGPGKNMDKCLAEYNPYEESRL